MIGKNIYKLKYWHSKKNPKKVKLEMPFAYIDYSDHGISFFFADDDEFMKVVDNLIDQDIKHQYENVTTDVLMSNYYDFDFGVVFANEEYLSLLEEFMEVNMSVDLILDKINLLGVDKLTDKERRFLKDN